MTRKIITPGDLAAMRDDRDRWQARARQAEGRVATLTQDLMQSQQQLVVAGEAVMRQRQGWDDLQQQLTDRVRQVSDLQAQLEAAAHLPDLRGEVERVAAERDAAREEVRGLQVRAEQAEGDARNATAKLENLQQQAGLMRQERLQHAEDAARLQAVVDVLRSVILDLFERMRNDG